MFAIKITLKQSNWLVLASVFLFVSISPAMSQSQAVESPDPDDSRRIERLGEVSTDEWVMDLALPEAAPIAASGDGALVLPDAEQNQKLQQLLSILATGPGDNGVLEQLNELLTDVLDQVNNMIDTGSLDQAQQLLSLIQLIDPGLAGLGATQNHLQVINETNELLSAANAALESGQILGPENNNALYYFNQALSKDPQSLSVQQGLASVQGALVDLALECANELDFETAGKWLMQASAVSENQQPVEDARIQVATIKQERAVELEQKAIAAMNSGNFGLADLNIIDLIALGGQQARVESLRVRLEEARFYGGFEPGQIISDLFVQTRGEAPDIVVIAAGSYLMGSKNRTKGALDNEKPRHRVTIEHGFGLGVTEVTVAQFRLFIEHTGYRTAAERKGSSSVYDLSAGRLTSRGGVDWEYDYTGKKAKPDLPVLHVNMYDAQAYVQWLALETGKAYRLPSEAEYEYVARAGGGGVYWWGDGSPSKPVENLTGDRDRSPGKRRWTTFFKKYGDGHWGPAPVGSIGDGKLVHPMGVHDIAGNVSEWTEDCWHQNYIKAPVDGSAWVNPGCERRIVRGGYWASSPTQSRAAFRISAKAETYGAVVGIRIARDL